MVLTTTLKNNVRSDIKDYLESVMTYGAVGDDNTTPTASDTTLTSEVFRDAIDDFDKTSSADSVTATLFIGPSEANGNTISEAGWFDASSGGNLQTHTILTAISKTDAIQLFLDTTITIEVTEG